jgi:hypothetical protein
MAFRPILPGIFSGAISGGAEAFAMTAGAGDGYDGYFSSQAALAFGESAIGSVTGDVSADGGTVEGLNDSGELYILNGNQGATNINIDGTDYALTYSGSSAGYDLYSFSGPDFVPGTTYQITVT